MAKQEQIDILLIQGVEAWNKWRKEHPDEHIDLNRTILSRTTLSGADLSWAYLTGAVLIRADLSRTTLVGAFLGYAFLGYADLNHADLSYAFLGSAKLGGANLRGANLRGANLSSASLRGANLRGANLSWTTLNGADLTGADLDGVIVGNTSFGDVDLSLLKNLETVQHQGPSSIGIDAIIRSQGKIPEIFLRGAGVPDSIIEAIPSLIGSLSPIDFYSCFISYSSKDEALAKRLHADLQSNHVRCWFAPEDLKIGAKIRPSIDESIRLHDKLLLILSHYSVVSQWIEQEVERALARERKEEKVILFPIRLDQTVMDIEEGWPALIRNTRNIGDFTRWKRHDAYQKSFARLLRDLQSTP